MANGKKNAKKNGAKNGKAIQRQILAAVESLAKQGICKNRDRFLSALTDALTAQDITLPTPVFKGVLAALSERDETADICTDAKGRPEPDADLRDFENVPLKDDIQEYFRREVLPHVADAWVDEDKTKKGYEIPFTRHFYKYTPLRPLPVIEAEIKTLEAQIQDMLREVIQ